MLAWQCVAYRFGRPCTGRPLTPVTVWWTSTTIVHKAGLGGTYYSAVGVRLPYGAFALNRKDKMCKIEPSDRVVVMHYKDQEATEGTALGPVNDGKIVVCLDGDGTIIGRTRTIPIEQVMSLNDWLTRK